MPDNTRTIDEIGEVKIDQVVIGSCTNGRLSDLRIAAEILRGKKVHEDIRCIIIPGTQKIYLEAMNEGLIKDFIEAGAVVSTPTCGPCLGGHMGILAKGERAVSTTNRNFVGRMGHVESEVYLASPAVAAASAIKKEFTLPSVTQTVILTRIEGRTPVPKTEDLERLAQVGASMAIFLSISMIDKVVAKLRSGYGRNVPVAVVERATWDNERCIIGTLDDIADKVKEAKITKCAQILVGDFIDCDYDKSLLYDKNFTHMFREAKE